MTDERWQEVCEKLAEKFSFEEKKTLPTEDGLGVLEMVVVVTPHGKIKLERTSHPKMLGTKTQYSKRIGSSVAVEKVYSDSEFVHTLTAYRWDETTNDWKEITPEAILS